MTDTQPSLFTMSRRSDPDTSRAAAERAARTIGRSTRQALVGLLEGPATDFELAERTGRQQTSIGKRRGDLLRRGLVEATEATRPSPSGSPARVWRLTDEGRQVAASAEREWGQA